MRHAISGVLILVGLSAPLVGGCEAVSNRSPDTARGSARDATNAPPAPGAFRERDGVLSIEAEHFATRAPSTFAGYEQEHTWEPATDRDGFSGEGFMLVHPDERTEDKQGPNSPRDASGAAMTYPVLIATPGTYHVFVRGMSMGGESNGLHVGVDDELAGREAGASNMSGFRPHHAWVWENQRKHDYEGMATLELDAGEHTLSIWNRDDGFRFDKIVLTLADERPEGTGPPESPRAER
ncbi:MAG: hypothetical protein WD009_08255 [Phycisphaeraceae bacterium]